MFCDSQSNPLSKYSAKYFFIAFKRICFDFYWFSKKKKLANDLGNESTRDVTNTTQQKYYCVNSEFWIWTQWKYINIWAVRENEMKAQIKENFSEWWALK